jgi:hypothetical protein
MILSKLIEEDVKDEQRQAEDASVEQKHLGHSLKSPATEGMETRLAFFAIVDLDAKQAQGVVIKSRQGEFDVLAGAFRAFPFHVHG